MLVLTNVNDYKAVTRFLQAGARAYLHTDCDPNDLVRAIERVHAGYLIMSVADGVFAGDSSGESNSGGLSEREQDVLRLVVQGRTNQEIASHLTITGHTVKGHLASILNKLGLENRVQVTAYAIQQGLVSPSDITGA